MGLVAPLSFDASIQQLAVSLFCGKPLYVMADEERKNPAALCACARKRGIDLCDMISVKILWPGLGSIAQRMRRLPPTCAIRLRIFPCGLCFLMEPAPARIPGILTRPWRHARPRHLQRHLSQ